MSRLAVGRGQGLEDLELWLAGFFTAAELAAAELLLQLSVAGGDGDKATASTSTTPSSSPASPRWVRRCREGLTVDDEEVEEPVVEETAVATEVEERVIEETAEATELDMKARKRYRRLSDLYAATSPVTTTSNTAKKNRKRCHDHDGSSSVVEATRYGGHN